MKLRKGAKNEGGLGLYTLGRRWQAGKEDLEDEGQSAEVAYIS